MIGPLRRNQQGQVLAMTAAVMTFLFVPLCFYLIDTGLVASSYVQLGDTLQVAAEDGASMIDEAAYRQSDGRTVRLDPIAARVTAERSLAASQLRLESVTVTVQSNTILVSARMHVQLMVLGSATISTRRGATFAYGP